MVLDILNVVCLQKLSNFLLDDGYPIGDKFSLFLSHWFGFLVHV